MSLSLERQKDLTVSELPFVFHLTNLFKWCKIIMLSVDRQRDLSVYENYTQLELFALQLAKCYVVCEIVQMSILN